MKKITTLTLLSLMLVSCGWAKEVVDTRDERIILCEAEAQKTQSRLELANTNPDIQLEFLWPETILWDISSCFLKVKITNPSDQSQEVSYNLFDIVREKTQSKYESLEQLEAEVERIREETEEESRESEGAE